MASLTVNAQQPDYNPYFPVDKSKTDWGMAAHVFYNNHNNSNSLSNEFTSAYNQSQYISPELKERQMNELNGAVLVGRTYRGSMGLWLKNKEKQHAPFFYFGVDFQEVLDGQVDEDFVGLVLYGNKRYAGQELNISHSEYTNTYFNRIKLGMGKTFEKGEIVHSLTGTIGLTFGQNFDYFNVSNATLFTQTDGEYLDMAIQAETKLGDTVWGNIFTVNGLGASADLHYSLHKDQNFFLALNIHNLGFVRWNGGPFVATADTSLRFQGLDNDSTNNEQIPSDFSPKGLRNLIFKNPDNTAFTETLPFHINFTAGKYFSGNRFYVGVNTHYYPNLISAFRAELFATWNIQEKYQITPIIAYSSFRKVNVGLAVGAHLWNSLSIRIGSSYLNSMFIKNSPAGQGGFVSLVFVH